jgi:APA family basic amino acid/polyamine antiporter
VLGLWDAVGVVVGSIIGSGVFLKAAVVATALGAFGPILSVWVVLGLVTLCGSLALAELAAMLPNAGGPYVYLREAYGRLPAFLWGWTEFWVVRTGSLGALTSATVIYLNAAIKHVYPLSRFEQGAVAVGLILFLTAVNWRSTRWGASFQNLMAVFKVGFLVAIIVLPFAMGAVRVENLGPIWPEDASGAYWRAIGLAAVAVLWPYDGWINIGPVAEEIKNPQRNIPVALTLGMIVIIVIYAAVNTVYHLVLPMGAVAKSQAVASDVFYVLFGNPGVQWAALGVMCSTLGATQSNLITGPRIYFAMARDGLLPARLAHVHNRYETPANAVLAQSVWASLLVIITYAWKDDPLAAFNALTDFVIFGGSLFYAMAVGAVFVLRWKRPELPRPYRTWGYPLTPAIYLVAFAYALISMFINTWQQSLMGSLLILAGVVYYYWAVRRERQKLLGMNSRNEG